MSASATTQPNDRPAVQASEQVEDGNLKQAAYSKPRLQRIGEADALLDILGPAQAFYGRTQP
jgi:hypothetical protein